LFWRELLTNLLPPGSDGIVCVIGNNCNPTFTYQINGLDTVYLGYGDQHETKYDQHGVQTELVGIGSFARGERTYSGLNLNEDFCTYWVKVYPSSTMEDRYTSKNPIIFTAAVVLIFLFTSMTFFLYDLLVEKRQRKVMRTAAQSIAILSSLFPSVVRDRLFPTDAQLTSDKGSVPFHSTKLKLQSFLREGTDLKGTNDTINGMSRPIAELFSDTTVMFADISGFTAWSSVREPTQVFILLETLYSAFDDIAKRRGVFKVETIGDSYVAVAGLPEKRKDHAVVMIRFARDCRSKAQELTHQLETTLGPDTGDLRFRFGLNSGPVTAGVLRGERSRFQLFGDTVNMASRMESTGYAGKIQVSQSTAQLLIAAGKSHWLTQREDQVAAKGKGAMQTYWAEPNTGVKSATARSASTTSEPNESSSNVVTGTDGHVVETSVRLDERTQRLIGWNVDVLAQLVKQIVARRENMKKSNRSSRKGSARTSTNNNTNSSDTYGSSSNDFASSTPGTSTVLDEVKEIIELPEFDASSLRNSAISDVTSISLDPIVTEQMRQFVTAVSIMYHENPFHNFEHASHVTMSVSKLMARIVAPDQLSPEELKGDKVALTLHDHTYGITSDPLTHFACVFAALIHDIDHQGVPNIQLVKENTATAAVYKNKSVAEQNSVDLAWDLFLDSKFANFRATICATADEMKRFRQLVVNSVMATDIMDQDLKALRNARWDRAFQEGSRNYKESEKDKVNRKATIVIEHLIQASDVAHTMQHWHVYRKWNERLFMEMYKAYSIGRAEKNPADFWYKGEIGFFDFYIIPLATKLSDCGVFGVSSDEYLNYTLKNRDEWEGCGMEVVAELVEKASALYKK
jgi:class 3 adenylate cyclase